MDAVGPGEAPRDRVLAAAAAQHEAIRPHEGRGPWHGDLRALLLDDPTHPRAVIKELLDRPHHHREPLVNAGRERRARLERAHEPSRPCSRDTLPAAGVTNMRASDESGAS